MKLLALLAVLLGLLSATAAEARHHRGMHAHAAIPLPKPRPVHHLEVDLGPRLFEQIQPKWRQATPTETQRIGLQILALTMVQR